jgi:hypothetical protein
MANVAPEQRVLTGRHRRPRRDRSGSTHSVHLRPVLHEFVGVLGYGSGLVCGWIGIRQFRSGAQVSGDKLTIRNELAGHPRHVPALGFTLLAQSLARHASQTHVSSRTRGNSRVADALRFAPPVLACHALNVQ